MNKKFRMTIRELLLSSKDYSDFTKDELLAQHTIIMNQYDDFKDEITSSVESKRVNTNIINIKRTQLKAQQNMFDYMLKEVDSHLRIIEDLLSKM